MPATAGRRFAQGDVIHFSPIHRIRHLQNEKTRHIGALKKPSTKITLLFF